MAGPCPAEVAPGVPLETVGERGEVTAHRPLVGPPGEPLAIETSHPGDAAATTGAWPGAAASKLAIPDHSAPSWRARRTPARRETRGMMRDRPRRRSPRPAAARPARASA